MIEMLAVVTITAFLLIMTISILKTDSKKANAQAVGGALVQAQAYAMKEGKEVKVTVNAASILVEELDPVASTFSEVTTIRLTAGSSAEMDTGTSPIFFNKQGEPGSVSDFTPLSTQTAIKITATTGNGNDLKIYVRPFTGKVAYYDVTEL